MTDSGFANEFWLRQTNPGLRDLKPYVPGKPISELAREQGLSDVIKLASNENPLGPSPKVIAKLSSLIPQLARYPDSRGHDLKQSLSRQHGLPSECITLGNGSNDVLSLLAQVFLIPGDEVVIPAYAFLAFKVAAQALGATIITAEPNPCGHEMPFGVDLAAMSQLVRPGVKFCYLANPNNPTGTWVSDGELHQFLEQIPPSTIVILDQAYFDYVDVEDYTDASSWLDRYPNLVVTRSFSKAHGLGGLRLGYALSNPSIAELLDRARQPFNVNSLALAAGAISLADPAHIEKTVSLNRSEQQKFEKFCDERGIARLPSRGNFVLINLHHDAMPIYQHLLNKGIIVRPVANYGLPNHLRITMGLSSEINRLTAALDDILPSSLPIKKSK